MNKIAIRNTSLTYIMNEDNEFVCDHDDGGALYLEKDSFSHEFGTTDLVDVICELGCDDVTERQASDFLEAYASDLTYGGQYA